MKKASGKSNMDIVRDYVAGNRPFTQTGWTSDSIIRKEGETWKSADGQSWTMQNGQKKAINNIGKNIDLFRIECKDCKKNIRLLGDRVDRTIHAKTGRCFICNWKYDIEMSKEIGFDKYELIKIFNNQKSYCLDMKQKLEESVEYLEKSDNKLYFMNEDGTSEAWTDTTRTKVLTDAKQDYKECLVALKKIEKQLKKLNGKSKSN